MKGHGRAPAISSDTLQLANKGRGDAAPAGGGIDAQAKKREAGAGNSVLNHPDHALIDFRDQLLQSRKKSRSLAQRLISRAVDLPKVSGGEAIDFCDPRIVRWSELSDF
jgi:hypothetical protein